MATSRPQEASISFAKGTAKDVELLKRCLVGARKAEQVRVLTRAAREGSRRMVAAALPLLIDLDVELAETLALELAERGAKRAKDEWMTQWLSVVATPKCMARAEEVFAVAIGTGEALERAAAWLPDALSRARARHESQAFVRDHFEVATPGTRAFSWFVQLLDAPDTLPGERLILFDVLAAARHEPTLQRTDLPLEYRALAYVDLPAAECFERLSEALRPLAPEDALTAFSGGRFSEPPDRRWLEWWQRRFEGDLRLQRDAMLAILCANPEHAPTEPVYAGAREFVIEHLHDAPWSDRTLRFVESWAMLSEAQYADFLLHGVREAVASYDLPDGVGGLADKVARFARCARAEQLAELEVLASRFEASEAPRYWLERALGEARERLAG